jgi:UDP-2,4-diacetamido-2,4,6-trideoxy-beta-L-altropyranose hydrolase
VVFNGEEISVTAFSVAFRTDASIQIGTGHVMRCLTLADVLRNRGADCTFICRPHSGHLIDLITHRGHQVLALPSLVATTNHISVDPTHAHWLGTDWQTDAQQTREVLGGKTVDWLVVDHYALDRRWEQILRPFCQNLMVIDDLADRAHDCDLLLDQNLGRMAQDYGRLLSPKTTAFIGPRYALLRPEFAQMRSQSLSRRTQPRLQHLLITMGGVDKDNATGQVLQSLADCRLPADLRITVVMGPHAPCLTDVQEQAQRIPRPTRVLMGVSDMAQLMVDSDLCIGAAGSTSWERCCLGLPTLLLVLADNQRSGATALAASGAVLFVPTTEVIAQVFNQLLEDSSMQDIQDLGQAAAAVTDGLGSERIASKMLSECPHA